MSTASRIEKPFVSVRETWFKKAHLDAKLNMVAIRLKQLSPHH